MFLNSNTATLVTVGGAVALSLTGGSVLAAKTSDGYRNFSEKYIPGTTFLHNIILGPKQIKIEEPPMYAPILVTFCWVLLYHTLILQVN